MMFASSYADAFSWLFVSIGSVFVALYLVTINRTKFDSLIFLAYLLRLGLLIADYYNLFPVIHSGVDTEAFHNVALRNQSGVSTDAITNYTDFLTLVYGITGSSRIVTQYINVLFGLGVILIVQKTIEKLQVAAKTERLVMVVICLFPHLIIFSAILLREAWVQFFVAASVLYFVDWFKNGGFSRTVMCHRLSAGRIIYACCRHRAYAGVCCDFSHL